MLQNSSEQLSTCGKLFQVIFLGRQKANRYMDRPYQSTTEKELSVKRRMEIILHISSFVEAVLNHF